MFLCGLGWESFVPFAWWGWGAICDFCWGRDKGVLLWYSERSARSGPIEYKQWGSNRRQRRAMEESRNALCDTPKLLQYFLLLKRMVYIHFAAGFIPPGNMLNVGICQGAEVEKSGHRPPGKRTSAVYLDIHVFLTGSPSSALWGALFPT